MHSVIYTYLFSAENNVNLYVQFSNCRRPILAMYNDQKFSVANLAALGCVRFCLFNICSA